MHGCAVQWRCCGRARSCTIPGRSSRWNIQGDRALKDVIAAAALGDTKATGSGASVPSAEWAEFFAALALIPGLRSEADSR